MEQQVSLNVFEYALVLCAFLQQQDYLYAGCTFVQVITLTTVDSGSLIGQNI
jgi:hypothetical protein